jgi:hypothetical protein
MNFFKKIFKKVEQPEPLLFDDTLGSLNLIDLKFRGKFWEVIHKDIRLLIAYDGVNKVPTEEVLSLARNAFQGPWLETSLRSAIDMALAQNPVAYHDKINTFSINSLSFVGDGRVFIGLCKENLWFAESVAGKIMHVTLDV